MSHKEGFTAKGLTFEKLAFGFETAFSLATREAGCFYPWFTSKEKAMSRICAITGKRPVKGRNIIHKGQSKKSGGIGLQLVKQTKRVFRPNVQRRRVKLPSGQVKRMWVSVKAMKAGLVQFG
jgi:large subunit ribosomal protein L28